MSLAEQIATAAATEQLPQPPAMPSLAKPAGAPSLAEQIAAARTPEEIGVPAIQQAVSAGVPQIQSPIATRGRRQLTSGESIVAKIAAAKQLESNVTQQSQLIGTLHAIQGLEQADPAAAHALGVYGPQMLRHARDTLASAGRAGITGIDMALSQLDRPRNGVISGLLAWQEGRDIAPAVTEGALSYGWHSSDKRRSFEDFLHARGWGEGTTLMTLPWIGPVTTTDMAGFVGDVGFDPITPLTIGPAKIIQLAKSGRWLNTTGRAAFDVLSDAEHIMLAPGVKKWLAERGAGNVIAPILEPAVDAAKAVLADPTNKLLREQARPLLKRAFDTLNKEIERAGVDNLPEGLVTVLERHHGATGIIGEDQMLKRPIHEAAQNRALSTMESLTEQNPALLKQWEDVGGIKYMGKTVVPLRPLRNALARVPMPEFAKSAADTVGRALSTTWGLPGDFARYWQDKLRSVYRYDEHQVQTLAESIFHGVDRATAEDMTRAIDGRTIDQFIAKYADQPAVLTSLRRMQFAQNTMWEMELSRGLVTEDMMRDNYIYHYYLNPQQLHQARIDRGRGDAFIQHFRDPSTYQRDFDTLAEAEQFSMKPEYDARKLFTMRLINGRRAVATHDFLVGTAERFGHLVKPQEALARVLKATGRIVDESDADGYILDSASSVLDDIHRAVKQAAGTQREPTKMWQMIRQHPDSVGLDQSARWPTIAERLVHDGAPPIEIIDSLPDGLKREFMRQRFVKAGMGVPQELANTERKYAKLKAFWPKGETRNVVTDALGLPRPQRFDGAWQKFTIPNVGDTFLPERIGRKLQEIWDTRVFSEAGQPMQTMLRWYNEAIINRFRKYVTSPFPAFHFRNTHNNIVQSAMDIGLAVLNPKTRVEAERILRGHNFPVRIGGKIVRSQQIRSEFLRYGGWNTLYERANVATRGPAERVAAEVTADLGPWRWANPLYWGKRVGTGIENDARMVHYLALRKDGIPANVAMARVRQYLYDYTNLTPTESVFFRTAIPFWTWTKSSAVASTKTLVERPRVFLTIDRMLKMLGDENGRTPEQQLLDRDLLPTYMNQQWAIPGIPEGRIQNMLLGVDLPHDTLNLIWQGDWSRTLDRITSQFGPTGRWAADLYDWVSDSPDGRRAKPAPAVLNELKRVPAIAKWLDLHDKIDPKTGKVYLASDEPARLRFLTGILLMDRPLRELSRVVGSEDSLTVGMTRLFTGARFEALDPEASLAERISSATRDELKSAQDAKQQLILAGIKGPDALQSGREVAP